MTIIEFANVVAWIGWWIWAIFTWWTVFEIRRTRREQESPNVQIYLEESERWGSEIFLVVENIWLNPAFNVVLSSDKDFQRLKSSSDEHNFIRNLGWFNDGISILASWAKRKNSFTFLTDDYNEKINQKLLVTVKYADANRGEYVSDFPLSLSEYKGRLRLSEPAIDKIAGSLKKIEDSLLKIGTNWRKFEVVTQTKDEFIQEREYRHIETEKQIKKLDDYQKNQVN